MIAGKLVCGGAAGSLAPALGEQPDAELSSLVDFEAHARHPGT